MKTKFMYIFLLFILIISIFGCYNNETKELKVQKLPDKISYNKIESITLTTCKYAGQKNEYGKEKLITQGEDFKKIADFLNSIDYKEIEYKELIDGEFSISLSYINDQTEEMLSGNSLTFTDNQINNNNIINYSKHNISSYKGNSELIKSLNSLYNKMNYKEKLLLKQ